MPRYKLLLFAALGLLLTGQACVRISSRTLSPTIMRSDDGGENWGAKDLVERFIEKKRERVITINGVSATNLLFSRANPNLIVLTTPANGLYLTHNRGDQWSASGYHGPVVAAALDPINDQGLALTDGRSVLRSTDGGRSWPVVFTLTRGDETLTGLVIDTYNPHRLLALSSIGIVYETTDQGQTWRIRSRIDDGVGALLMHPADSRILFAYGRTHALWRSTDGGGTWQSLNSSFEPVPPQRANLALWFVSPNDTTIYSTGGHSLLKSIDLGSSWSAVRSVVSPPVAVASVSVHPTDPQRVAYVIGAKLHRTDDGGATWTVTTLPTNRPPRFLVRDPNDLNVFYLGSLQPPKK